MLPTVKAILKSEKTMMSIIASVESSKAPSAALPFFYLFVDFLYVFFNVLFLYAFHIMRSKHQDNGPFSWRWSASSCLN
jgi:hypothetical protein